MKQIAIVIVAALALGGCDKGAIPAADFNFASVTLGQDNYCELARKRTWHTDDTTETINGLRAENRKWTCLCTQQRGTPSCKKYQQSASIAP